MSLLLNSSSNQTITDSLRDNCSTVYGGVLKTANPLLN